MRCALNTIDMWVRILNVPIAYRTKEMTNILAQEAGMVVEAEFDGGRRKKKTEE
uniref:DUF4283 domain-containing protein n=1 Tax=Nelumbo nucifera TaxID=4432 RepID=A0A822XTF8_NELNU|nr:TPA_asm: hypothetical protein HUJ06_024466 [Nelumbo nucifera]